MKLNLNLLFAVGATCIIVPHALVLLAYFVFPALQDRAMPVLIALAFVGTVIGAIILAAVAISGWLSRGR